MAFVLIANDTEVFGYLPVDSEIGIIEQNTAICFGMVEVIALIGKDRLIAQHGEAMRKSAGDIELTFVLFTQFDAEPLPEGLAAFAQIDGYVQYTAYGAAHQLRLAVRRALEMQSAYDSVTRTGLVILHKTCINTNFAVPLFVIGLHEIAACVLKDLGFDDQ